MSAFLTSSVGVLGLIAAGLVALGIIYRQLIRPVLHGTRRIVAALEIVESEVRTNGGGSMKDAVVRIEEKVDSHVTVWTEQQASLRNDLVAEKARVADALDAQAAQVREALEAQAASVRTALVEHSNEVDREFMRVWRELGTRDIHRSVDALTDAADRAERAIPPTDPKGDS